MEYIYTFKLDIKSDINNLERGNLLPIESLKNIPFELKRFFIIRDIKDKQSRGFHSHKKTKQIFILIQGNIDIILDDGNTKKTFNLKNYDTALYVPENIWCVMENISEDCILQVLCSEYYDENEYCRDYDEFLKIKNKQINVPGCDLIANTQSVKNEVLIKINDVIDSANYVLGKELDLFETSFAEYIGSSYCVGLSNGTATLIAALQAFDLNDDAEVITQANTYIAAPLAISRCNLKLKIVDCDDYTLMMDLDKLEESITDKTKVIIVVHLYGACPDMDRLMNIVKKNNLYLIEDAAQSHGSTFKGKKLGSFGDIGSFSFYPSKNLGAFGEAGCIVTDNIDYYKKIRLLRNYGSEERYVWEIKGLNERMDTIQGAILNVKLKYLDEWNQNRNIIANYYHKHLQDNHNIKLLGLVPNNYSCYHLYVIKVYESDRDPLLEYLKNNNIGAGIHYPWPFYKSEAYKEINHLEFPVTENNVKRILSLPIYPEMTLEQAEYVCSKIRDYYFNQYF